MIRGGNGLVTRPSGRYALHTTFTTEMSTECHVYHSLIIHMPELKKSQEGSSCIVHVAICDSDSFPPLLIGAQLNGTNRC